MAGEQIASAEPGAAAGGDAPLAERAKSLLDLAIKDRRAAEEAFSQLGFETQLETALALQGDTLQDWLLLSADCTDLVRAMPPEHLHQAIKLIGEEDALALLAAASSEQLRALTDIEWFTDGKLDRKKVRRWVELLMELNEDEADQAMQGLDPNVLAAFLRPAVQPTVSQEQLLLALHLQQHYLFTPDDLETNDDLIERFIRYLYAVDRDLFGEVLELMVTEEPETVEADLYGDREDRLLKRGFPALARAERLLEPADLRHYGVEWPAESAGEARATGTALQRAAPTTPFLLSVLAWGRAKGELGERTERAFIQEAADLANSILIAHAKNPTEPNVKRDALAAVQVLTSVGLEAVTSGNVIAAAERLKAMDAIELFRLGWTLTRQVSREAWSIATDSRIESRRLGQGLAWLPERLREAVRDAETLMSWRQIGATAVGSGAAKTLAEEEEEAEVTDAEIDRALESHPGQPVPPLELLTWPRLCRLRKSVQEAREELERRVGG